MKKIKYDNILNCILGGAIGDALGGPVRDMSYDLIIDKYGKRGLNGLEIDCDNKARVSANTQLTIFTIDGVIKEYTTKYIYGKSKYMTKVMYTNYIRWQYYQGRKISINMDKRLLKDNYLYSVQELKYERYPEQRMADILETEMIEEETENENNFNDGWACLTKTAPIGLVYYEDLETAFDTAVKVAKLTHGHPNAYLSCGVLAVIIASLMQGNRLEVAIQTAIDMLKQKENASEVLRYIALALDLAKDKIHYPEKFDDFGLCDQAHETLAAAIYVCLIGQENISKALVFSVNNSAYGNNIATIVGQVLGIYLGLDDVCKSWSTKLEMYELMKDISNDLFSVIMNKLPKQIDNYDKELNTNDMKYKSVKNIAKWWLIKYDKI